MGGLSEILSALIKLIVNALQVFLIFLRPFSEKYRNRWTLWLASSCQQLQLFLAMGGITGNFGGLIDSV
jgi:hypothetical protein